MTNPEGFRHPSYAESDAARATVHLRAWYEAHNSDSKRESAEAENRFRTAADMLSGLVMGSSTGMYKVMFTVGPGIHFLSDREMPVHSIGRDYAGTRAHDKDPMLPGQTLELSIVHKLEDHVREATYFYFGESYMRMIELGELAQALAQGSTIGVEFEEHVPAAQTAA